MNILDLKINPNNPQKFKDLHKLENSIKEFPKMMELRPLVYESETRYVLGGNKRLICLLNLGFKEIPDNWAVCADNLTDDEKKRFIIADNIGFGEWDFEKLKEWDENNLIEWGLDIDVDVDDVDICSNSNDDDFIDKINEFDDSNCKLPIVPDFFENHQCFIIPCHNDIDVNFIRDLFGLNENFISNSGDKKERKTNVINIETIKKWTVK